MVTQANIITDQFALEGMKRGSRSLAAAFKVRLMAQCMYTHLLDGWVNSTAYTHQLGGHTS